MGLFDGFFAAEVAVAQGDPSTMTAALYPVEQSFVSCATEPRRREFAAGRALARQAMASLGLPPAAIPARPDRAPVWPDGIIGSISHCDHWCVAAVARQSDSCRSIGIDVEPATPLDKGLLDIICSKKEMDWLEMQPVQERLLLAKVIFSAKESFYKSQYPLSRQLVDFHAVSIMLDLSHSSFAACVETDLAPLAAGQNLEGHFCLTSGFIATAMTLAQNVAGQVEHASTPA